MLMDELSPKDQALRQLSLRLDDEFPFYARRCLKIRTESGSVEPFVLNYAQSMLHAFVEKQRRELGRVRILVPKARQEGCSTYIGGRFYQKTTRKKGKATFILSHAADTTEKLFAIVERYHKYCPEPAKMQTDTNNRRRMVFSGMESEYFVGTAGNDDVGRGGTIQHLHASECAFYPDSDGFTKGILQSVPDIDDTEVFLESTANGMDKLFYKMCMDAINGSGDFRLFFLPWFWKPTYRRKLSEDFKPTEEECNIANLYKLDWEQIYWRRMKLQSMKNDIKAFMQEYPANIEEAFISSGSSLVSSFKFMEARKSLITDGGAPLVIGIDGNEANGRNGVVFRRGRHIEKAYAITGKSPMELVGIFADMIDRNEPVKMFCDLGNNYGVIDRLVELGYGDIVMPVSFNDGPIHDDIFLNKRVEMWDDFAKWINGGGVRVPDEDIFHKESCAVTEKKRTSSGLFKLEPKEKIEDDSGLKIDIADAAALTFAYPVRRDMEQRRKLKKLTVTNTPSKLKSIQRREGMRGTTSNAASSTIAWPK